MSTLAVVALVAAARVLRRELVLPIPTDVLEAIRRTGGDHVSAQANGR